MWFREAFLGNETLLPELPAIGRSRQTAAVGGSLIPHEHRHAYELVLVESGRLQWWVEDERHTLASGMIFLTRPGERHGALDEVLEPSDIRWAQFRLDLKGAFGLQQETLANLRGRLDRANRTASAVESHRNSLKCLLREHQHPKGRPEIVRAHSICLLDDIADALNRPIDAVMDPRIEEAIVLMRANLQADLPVEVIANHLCLSPSWFHELFLRCTGITKGEWLAKERIDQAKVLLDDPTFSITSIAHDLGFSSSQYFATVFKKQTGQTPREFRSSKLEQ